MRTILLTVISTLALQAADGNPILRWLVNPAAATTSDPALRAILPNVQSVRVDGTERASSRDDFGPRAACHPAERPKRAGGWPLRADRIGRFVAAVLGIT